jgi:hypothetical protein
MKYYTACTRYLGVIYANQPSYTIMYHSFNHCPAEDALPKAVLEAMANMGTDPASFHKTENMFSGPLRTAAKCSTCFERLVDWKGRIASGTDSVRKFSTFI